ncbi:MAG: hypothetical protein IKU97_01990, partial [Tidjanibacter sp.]|nr:hypothetical protein [Tidjanibacter sp.]
MKRFFTNLKAMATKMLAVALVGVAAVACAEAYDDTDLRNQVADLAQRVSDLEDRLDNEVVALRALIDQKVALAEVAADGAWQFTLADGKTLTLYPEYVENGLTVVTEGGVQYWAKVEGNIVTVLKDAAGNKVAVHNAPVPELRVNAEGAIEVSIDGGATWVATQAPSLFAAIDVKENMACMTLQNGEVLKFALYEQVNFSINGNALFVAPAASEKVAMTLDGIVEIIPLVVPNGWSVAVDGLVMTVTAPAEVEVEEDYGGGIAPLSAGASANAATGVVKVLAISKEGKAVVANLYVNAAPEGAMSMKVIGDQVVFTNNRIGYVGYDYETWEPIYGPLPIAYTAFPAGEYTVESFLKAKNSTYDYKYEVLLLEGVSGTKSIPVAELLAETCEVETIKPGEAYTILAWDDDAWPQEANIVMMSTYTYTNIEVAVSNTTFKDAQLDVTFEGFDGCKVVLYDTTYGQNAQEDFQMWQMYASQGQPWGVDMTANYSGSVFDLSSDVRPYANRVYALYYLPLSALKNPADYAWEDVQYVTFKTKNYAAGGMLQPTIGDPSVDYQNFYVEVTPAEGAYMTHAWYFTATEMANLTDEALVAEIVAKGYLRGGSAVIDLYNDEALMPGTTVTIAAISVDQNGKYGPIVKKECSTQGIQYSAVTVEITDWNLATPSRSMTINDSSYTFGVNVSGELANVYMYLITNWNQYMTVEKEAAKIAVNILDSSVSKYIPLADVAINEAGKYAPVGKTGPSYSPKYMGLEYGKEYCLAIFGVDAEGKPTNVACQVFDTYVPMTVVYADDARWTASKPTVALGATEVLGTMYDVLKENWDFFYNMLVNDQGYTEEEAKAFMEMMVSYGELQDPEKLTAEEKAAPASLNATFTVTPGAGAVKCLVKYSSDGNFDEIA